ncbi:MAG TPA: Crp/Fnr family transcriptional regulator [Bacteroidales bacterium]|nr:Crp/Fnr family transcriptional regulator [Bacteroidales bacterium]
MLLTKEILLEQFTFNSRQEFESLPENVRMDFLKHMVVRRYRRGDALFVEGNYPAGLYYIMKGYAKKFKLLAGYGEQIINIYGSGELIGYAALLSQERYPDSAVTLSEAEIGFVSAETLNMLQRKYDDLSRMLMRNLGHEFGVLSNIIASNAQRNIRQRVAIALLIFGEKMNLNEQSHRSFKVPRKEIAGMVAASVESIVRVLRQFQKEGIISIKGRKITIHDEQALLKISL